MDRNSSDSLSEQMGDLINLGELSKPATVLIEKVCSAVGIVFEPTRIRRKAKAEADAQLTSAGKQLMAICGSERNDAFYHYVIRSWSEAGIITSSLIP